MYESDRHRGNAGKNDPLGVMGTFVVRLAMPVSRPSAAILPVKGEMRRFIHEAEDLVVFAPDLYKRPAQADPSYGRGDPCGRPGCMVAFALTLRSPCPGPAVALDVWSPLP